MSDEDDERPYTKAELRAEVAAARAREKALRPWYKRPGVIILVALAVFVLIGIAMGGGDDEEDGTEVATDTTAAQAAAPAETTATTTGQAPATVAPSTAPKQWVGVFSVSGSANKRTNAFRLDGGPARMRYKASGNALFAPYIVAQGDSLEKSGGFPEVTCTESCQDETHLVKDAGEYYLDVKATGPWSIVIEEMR